MSKRTQPRIKQIRQKSSSGYLTGIPLGADGLLVDMLSGLDLEEELRLGGNHYVEIVDTEVNEQVTTTIKEWYFTQPKGENTIAQMKEANKIPYSAQIVITDDEITMSLYEGDITDNKVLHQKSIVIDEVSTSTTNISEEVDA